MRVAFWVLVGVGLVLGIAVAFLAKHFPECGCAPRKPLWCYLGLHIWQPVYRDKLVVEHRCSGCGRFAHDDSALLKSLFRND